AQGGAGWPSPHGAEIDICARKAGRIRRRGCVASENRRSGMRLRPSLGLIHPLDTLANSIKSSDRSAFALRRGYGILKAIDPVDDDIRHLRRSGLGIPVLDGIDDPRMGFDRDVALALGDRRADQK